MQNMQIDRTKLNEKGLVLYRKFINEIHKQIVKKNVLHLQDNSLSVNTHLIWLFTTGTFHYTISILSWIPAVCLSSGIGTVMDDHPFVSLSRFMPWFWHPYIFYWHLYWVHRLVGRWKEWSLCAWVDMSRFVFKLPLNRCWNI